MQCTLTRRPPPHVGLSSLPCILAPSPLSVQDCPPPLPLRLPLGLVEAGSVDVVVDVAASAATGVGCSLQVGVGCSLQVGWGCSLQVGVGCSL